MGELAITYRPVGDLKPYRKNARTHSDAQIQQIADSIERFGWTNPVLVDARKGILAGHGRILAATLLGIESVPCIDISGLTPAKRRAYIIADNKLAINAGWDDELLGTELNVLVDLNFDLDVIGFGADELEVLLNGANFEPGSEDDQGRLDEKIPTICPECGHEF